MNKKDTKPLRELHYLEDVIASIASTAVMEVPGVAGMAQRPADL